MAKNDTSHPTTPPTTHNRRALVWGAAIGTLAVTGGLAATASGALAAAQGSTQTSAQVQAEPLSAAAAVITEPTTGTSVEAVLPSPVAPTTDAAGSVEPAGTGLMPEGYTAEQYDAFWGAGYTAADADALAALWSTDVTSAKARAGQALLDGTAVPVAPGENPDGAVIDDDPLWSAFAGAGYTYDDAVALAALWSTDVTEAKARIGQAVLAGEALPIAPGSADQSAVASTPAG